jgi:two-component system sensor histidine kinase UhpB
MQTMTLSVRLNLLIALLLLLLLGAGATSVVISARKAVDREIQSSVSLTLGLLTAATATTDAAGLRAVRAALIDRLGKLEPVRHLDIAVLGPDGVPLLPVVQAHAVQPAQAPDWFVALVRPATVEYRHRIGAPGGPFTEIAVRPNPGDEITEAWERSRTDLLLLLTFAAIAMLLISWTVSRAFRPVEHILTALDVIQSGDYSTRLAEPHLPELQRIALKLNRMAQQLESQEHENRALRSRTLAMQESERKSLALELHDELGQAISAIKALAVSIGQRPGSDDARERAGTIAAVCDELHQTVRNMSRRLRPVVLDELGLVTALRRAVEEWNDHDHGMVVSLDVVGDIGDLEDQTRIHLYRIVQEGLTNATRHAQATEVRVSLTREGAPSGPLHLQVADNGIGFDPRTVRSGLGLLGMRERARSLGGELHLESAPGKGTVVRLSLPMAGSTDSVQEQADDTVERQ